MIRAKRFITTAILLVVLSLPTLGSAPWTAPTLDDVVTALDGLDFDEFIEESFQIYFLRYPEIITAWGLSSTFEIRNDALNNYSSDYQEDSHAIANHVLSKLQAFNRQLLSEKQAITYDIALKFWEDEANRDTNVINYPLTWNESASMDGWLYDTLTRKHPFSTRADVEDYLARLRGVDTQIDQIIEAVESLRDCGIVAPRMVFQDVQHRVYLMMSTSTSRYPYHESLQTKGSEIAEISKQELAGYLEEASQIIDEQIKPAYRRLYFAVVDVLEDSPHALPMSQFASGDRSYTLLVGHYTDTNLSLDQIYALASQRLERIRSEIQSTAEEAGIEDTSSLAAIFDAAAANAGQAEGDEAVAEAQALLDAGKELLIASDAFVELPDLDVEVQGGKEGGVYVSGALDGSRPAIYYVDSFFGTPRYVLPTTTYHETFPGHHVQKTIAESLNVPMLRQIICDPSFSEGWATYAEQLMDELGAYDEDPYGRIGWLEGEIYVAVGMMADIALHHLGWSLDQLQRFIVDNTGFSRPEAYGLIAYTVAQPGRIMSYSFGQLEILALREQARAALGDAFELKTFHDLVLGNGNVPLSYVRQLVEEWISEEGQADSGA